MKISLINIVNKQKFIFPILLVLTCMVVNVFMYNKYSDNKLSPDQNLYNAIATSILKGETLYCECDTEEDIGLKVTPFYSTLVALSYYIGGNNYTSAYGLNVLLNCLTILILYFTLNILINHKIISFFLCFSMIFYYILWSMNFSILMEITTVFFMSLDLYLIAKFYYNQKINYLYLASAFQAILCLINNRFIVLQIVFWILLLIYIILKQRHFIKNYFYSLSLFILVLSPWFIRQYIVYDQFVFFTPLWHNVIEKKFGFLDKVNVSTDADKVREITKKPLSYIEYLNEIQANEKFNKESFTKEKYQKLIVGISENKKSIILENFLNYFSIYNNEFRFVNSSDYRLVYPSGKVKKYTQIVFLIPLMLMSLVASLIAVYKKNYYVILLMAFFVTHVLLFSFWGFIERYRITIIPIIFILGAYGMVEVYKLIVKNKKLQNG